MLLDNGAIQMKVLAKTGNQVECEVLTEGTLGSRRHINLPGVKVSLPALTAKDIADVKLGLEVGVDFIALSFVREARDLLQLKELFAEGKPRPLVIAKIEDQQAVTESRMTLCSEADAIMVARGDLGIEIPYEELPIVQRRIVKTCLRLGKPVIVATHMLESMIESPMPTRAEVTDVANAVYEQADAIMLSGETTVGKYPVKCIEVFDRIAERIERSGGANFFEAGRTHAAAPEGGQERRGHGQRTQGRGHPRVHPPRQHGALHRLAASAVLANLRPVRRRRGGARTESELGRHAAWSSRSTSSTP